MGSYSDVKSCVTYTFFWFPKFVNNHHPKQAWLWTTQIHQLCSQMATSTPPTIFLPRWVGYSGGAWVRVLTPHRIHFYPFNTNIIWFQSDKSTIFAQNLKHQKKNKMIPIAEHSICKTITFQESSKQGTVIDPRTGDKYAFDECRKAFIS